MVFTANLALFSVMFIWFEKVNLMNFYPFMGGISKRPGSLTKWVLLWLMFVLHFEIFLDSNKLIDYSLITTIFCFLYKAEITLFIDENWKFYALYPIPIIISVWQFIFMIFIALSDILAFIIYLFLHLPNHKQLFFKISSDYSFMFNI